MNLRSFATMSAVAMFVLGGCVVVTSNGTGGGGSGGSGNVGNEGGSSTGGKGGAGGSGPGVGGGGGQGGAAACSKCGDFVSDPMAPAICPMSDSEKLYNELALCTCGSDAMGTGAKCFEACKASACTGVDPDKTCQDCLNTPMTGCQAELGACVGDI